MLLCVFVDFINTEEIVKKELEEKCFKEGNLIFLISSIAGCQALGLQLYY